MEKKTKKPALKATTKKVKPETKKTTGKVESKVETKIDSTDLLKSNITKLESAYVAAISGKMKFAQVKDIFKKIHKEIKETTKKNVNTLPRK